MKWLLLLLTFGCAQVTSLNLQKHEFGVLPTKIIWFQIAGLEEEQLGLLRFNLSGERKTAFEEHTCIGKSWGYSLYQLRETAEASFLSQITGRKNIKNNCEDAELRPIWNYLNPHGYNTGIFEVGSKGSQPLTAFKSCGDKGKEFLQGLFYWTRQTGQPGEKTFHYREPVVLMADEVFGDRSCDQQKCTSTITENVRSIYDSFKKVSRKHMFIIRDFSYLEALEKKDFIQAKEILADLERALSESLSNLKESPEHLILVTSGDSRFVDLPDQGKSWYEFEKNPQKNIQVKRTKLTNLVIASGARAENFCGLYDDSQIFRRILSGPKQLGLELKFINPFK